MSASMAVLDPAVLGELRELGQELGQDVLGDVVEAFRKLAAEKRALLTDQLSRGEHALLSRTAHALKGASAQIGARRLFEAARTLEVAAREGRTTELEGLVGNVQSELVSVDGALAALGDGA